MFLIIQDINLRFHPHQVIKMPADRFTDNLENTFLIVGCNKLTFLKS